MRLTETHRDIIENSASGFCIRGVWHWTRNGEAVTRQVNTLMKNGLIKATYFSGGNASTYKV